jgi:type IV secretion system protein VirB3
MATGDAGKVSRDPLFLALTRPAMLFGVTYSWFAVSFLGWLAIFVNTKNFGLLIPGLITTHVVGYYACSYEPRFMEIIKIWAQTVPTCINRFYHGNTCSYDLY